MISVYTRSTEIELNIRKLETIDRYSKLIQWGRRNPIQFIELVFNIVLIDFQKWVLMNTWTSEQSVWTESRNAGKSFLGAVYILARSILFPSHQTYIMSNTGFQAKETFTKMENIVKKNIASLLKVSDMMFNEIIKNSSNVDGFTHNASQYQVEFYNGSKVTSLVGKAENVVGYRSNLNFYDEAGKIDDHFFALTKPFTTQDTNFKTGGGFDERVYPLNISTQNIYASSAEGVDSYLWKQYVDCSKNMIMGVPGFFCADITCEMPLHPTVNGEPTRALLKQSEVDSAMRTNEARALREYYNIFDTAGGSDSAVQRSVILRNEFRYLPCSESTGDDKHYVLCYDPALQADDSFVLIAEIFRDKVKGWKARIVNGINLIEHLGPNDKRTLRTPEQLQWLRDLLVVYNGNNSEYNNVHLYLDAGSGGAGRNYGDFLLQSWIDKKGVSHKGITDLTNDDCIAQKDKYPLAVDCLHIMEPTKYKTPMYLALQEMMQQDLVELPIQLPHTGVMTMDDDSTANLTMEEIRAILEIDLMKEELMAMQKIKSNAGNIIFKLPANKEKKIHDDRAYCCALLCWHLSELRRKELVAFERPSMNFADFLLGAQIKTVSTPFGNRTNPFAGKSPFGR